MADEAQMDEPSSDDVCTHGSEKEDAGSTPAIGPNEELDKQKQISEIRVEIAEGNLIQPGEYPYGGSLRGVTGVSLGSLGLGGSGVSEPPVVADFFNNPSPMSQEWLHWINLHGHGATGPEGATGLQSDPRRRR